MYISHREQSVEIPFVKLDDVERVKKNWQRRLQAGCVAQSKNSHVPGNQICPSGNIDTYDIAKKLDARYARRASTSSSSVSQDARTTV